MIGFWSWWWFSLALVSQLWVKFSIIREHDCRVLFSRPVCAQNSVQYCTKMLANNMHFAVTEFFTACLETTCFDTKTSIVSLRNSSFSFPLVLASFYHPPPHMLLLCISWRGFHCFIIIIIILRLCIHCKDDRNSFYFHSKLTIYHTFCSFYQWTCFI